MASARLAVEIEARTDGESGAETWWLSVLAFGRTAESLMRHAKGEPMSVSGRLQSQRWTDRATGERREDWQCIADAIVSARSVRPGGCRRSGIICLTMQGPLNGREGNKREKGWPSSCLAWTASGSGTGT